MSVQIADHKIALRDFIRAQASVTAIVPSSRIVLDYGQVTDAGNWLVLSRSGGMVDLYVPVRKPRVDIVCYGANRWEAVRLMQTVGTALGFYNPRAVPRIQGTGVVITDIQPEADITEGTDTTVPGLDASVPFAMQATILTVHTL
jgi:hypothetical protein